MSDSSSSLPSSPSSLWQLKPWWCQPWSIILTGLVIPAVAWLLFHRVWLMLPIVGAIAVWWVVFLHWVPRQYADYLRQTDRLADTLTDAEP